MNLKEIDHKIESLIKEHRKEIVMLNEKIISLGVENKQYQDIAAELKDLAIRSSNIIKEIKEDPVYPEPKCEVCED